MLDPAKIYQEIESDLEELDLERIKYHNKVRPFKITFWTLFFGGIAIIAYAEFNSQANIPSILPMAYIPTTIITMIVFIFVWQYNLRKFKVIFADRVAPKIIKGLGDSFTYEHKGGISATEIAGSMFFESFSKYQHEDLIKGTIGTTAVSFNEVVLSAEKKSGSSSGGTKSSVNIFRGFFFLAYLAIDFPANIWLVSGWNSKRLRSSDYTKIKIDHPALKRYTVYTDNEDLAKKILQPAILQHIDELNKKLKKKKISLKPVSLHFSKHIVHIAISTSNKLLEPRLSKSINTLRFIEEQTLLLNALYGLTNDLTLD